MKLITLILSGSKIWFSDGIIVNISPIFKDWDKFWLTWTGKISLVEIQFLKKILPKDSAITALIPYAQGLSVHVLSKKHIQNFYQPLQYKNKIYSSIDL